LHGYPARENRINQKMKAALLAALFHCAAAQYGPDPPDTPPEFMCACE
jgi:hypothetical protein